MAADEAVANRKFADAQAIKDDCEKELAKAVPALNAATDALNTLKQDDIRVVKAMKNPPSGVKLVGRARAAAGWAAGWAGGWAGGLSCLLGSSGDGGLSYLISWALRGMGAYLMVSRAFVSLVGRRQRRGGGADVHVSFNLIIYLPLFCLILSYLVSSAVQVMEACLTLSSTSVCLILTYFISSFTFTRCVLAWPVLSHLLGSPGNGGRVRDAGGEARAEAGRHRIRQDG